MILVHTIFLTLILAMLLPAQVASKQQQLLSPSATMMEIEQIKKYAIVMGEGEKDIHTFIDPYGEMSQRYLRMIYAKRKVMFKKYRLYLYLLALPRQESGPVIKTILSSDDKLGVLLKVMLKERQVTEKENPAAKEAIREIHDAATRIGVHKRPYMIINGKVR